MTARMKKFLSDFYDRMRAKPQPDGWTKWEDVEGLACRAFFKSGEVINIDVRSWKEVAS